MLKIRNLSGLCVNTSSLNLEYEKASVPWLLKNQFAFHFQKLYHYLPQVKIKKLLFSESPTYTQSFLFWKTFEIGKYSQVNRKSTQVILENT